MANRKVLINRHTSTSGAPVASEMFYGEIAVAHKTGEEIIWTKNNADQMVPFISCAQTIAIIDSKVQASEDSVKAKAGELHIEVESAGTADATEWIISTKDVQSESAFNGYSAATKDRIDQIYSAETGLTAVVSALTDVIVTAITGDNIITAEKVENGTGSNEYNITHKSATAVNGFNKLDTDAYGHVTAATAVATSDIQALGFKTSAETEADLDTLFASAVTYTDEQIDEVYASGASLIAKEIAKLDSSTGVSASNKYLTGIGIENGKITGMTEQDLPVLSVESAGTGNVVSSIAVNDHKITYQTTSVATSTDIQNLSAATINLSGAAQANESNINALSAGTIHDIEALSGDVIAYVKVVSGDIETVINELSAGTIADNNKLSADVITYINTISGYVHGEIAELSGAVMANETDIDNLSAATLDLSAVTLTGVSLNNTPLEVNNHIVSVPVAVAGSEIEDATASGKVADAKAVKEYVESIVSSSVNYKGSTGSTPTAATKGDLYIASQDFVVGNQSAETGDFIIYNGTSWDVIEKNLDGAVTGNLTADTVTLGNGVNEVKSLANGTAGQVLTVGSNGPEWDDLPQLSTASTGAGNVVTSIAVSDHEITFAKDFTAATNADVVALSAGTIQLSADTKAAIEALSAGTIQLSADTKNTIAALSAGTIQLSADTKAAIADLSANTEAAIAAAIDGLDSSTATTDAKHYLTSITITNGEITAMGEAEVPAGVKLTTVDGATGNTAAAAISGVFTGGTDGHQLTLSATNKIFSAETSDSAITAVSAQTSVNAVSAQTSVSAVTSVSAITSESALTAAALTGNITSGQVSDLVAGIQNTKVNSAYTAESADTAAQVANALSVSGYSTSSASSLDTAFNYDGSEGKSLTFGTNGNAGLKSMSMTSAGVVDVEVIDCGEY